MLQNWIEALRVRRDFSVYVLINAFSLFDPALIKQLLLDATQGMTPLFTTLIGVRDIFYTRRHIKGFAQINEITNSVIVSDRRMRV